MLVQNKDLKENKNLKRKGIFLSLFLFISVQPLIVQIVAYLFQIFDLKQNRNKEQGFNNKKVKNSILNKKRKLLFGLRNLVQLVCGLSFYNIDYFEKKVAPFLRED